MNAGTDDCGGNTGGKVAIPNEANACPGFANIGDELFMTGAIQNDDDEVFDITVEPLGNRLEIVGDGCVKVDGAFAGGADDDFFHIKIGCVEEAAPFAGSENGDGICGASGAEICSFERVDGDVNGGKICVWRVSGEAYAFADVKHGGFVALAFADDDNA